MSSEIAELRSWAESEVVSYWCAIHSTGKGTKKKKSLVESLSPVLCTEVGTEWKKITWEEVEGECLTEIECKDLLDKIKTAAGNASASRKNVMLEESVQGMLDREDIKRKEGKEMKPVLELSRHMYLQVDSDYYRPTDGHDAAEHDSWGPDQNDPAYFLGAFVWIMHTRGRYTRTHNLRAHACITVHGSLARLQ